MNKLNSLLLVALAALSLGAASAGVTTDLRTALAEHGANGPTATVVPNAACDVGEPDLIVHDDGELENGYGYNSLASDGYLADLFTPGNYPATVSTVCVAFITNAGITSVNGWLEVYADDGAGGAPGTLLGSKAVTFPVTSIAGLPAPAPFAALDISDLGLVINSGSAYVAVHVPGTDGLFLASDQSASTPLAGGHTYADSDPWTPIQNTWPDYRAMMIRAAFPAAGPGAPSVQKAFAPAQVLAGEPSTLTITLRNTTQPTDAVLAADFSDNLPTGLAVASPANASTTCVGGTLTANAGDASITLSSGAAIPAGDVCTITVDVTGASDGLYTNTIPAGALQTNHGNNAGTATANLKIGFTFPEPYCPVTFPSGIEPITRVVYADIDNTSPATGGPALQDFTAIVGHVTQGQTVNLSVEGNTAGNFQTPVVAYIDWNQDGVFDPGTEKYSIGTLVNSTGTDSQSVDADIIVPVSALPGNTRMRVLKKWNTEGDPCNSAGFGQAEDYTLNVSAPTVAPTMAKAFAPASVEIGAASTLTITLDNSNNSVAATLTANLVDTFPTGLVVANTPNAATTCTGGSLTASAGAGSVTLAAGAGIPANGSCTVSVDVQSATIGSYTNTLAAGALQTDLGDNAAAATATLAVVAPTCYTLSLSHTGNGADPTTSPANSPTCPAGQYVAGATVNLTAAPAAGWQVQGWSGTDNNASTATTNVVTMPAADHAASVSYEAICYTLSLSHTGNGADPTTSPANSPTCPAGQYVAGATVNLTAAPAAGWQVQGWSGTDNDASTATANTMTMSTGDHAVSVTYQQMAAAPHLVPANNRLALLLLGLAMLLVGGVLVRRHPL